MFVSTYGDLEEVLKAAPYLERRMSGDVVQVLADGYGVLVYDSVEEMEVDYWETVGDDGPTKTNPYLGPAKVYALTCVNGELLNENT